MNYWQNGGELPGRKTGAFAGVLLGPSGPWYMKPRYASSLSFSVSVRDRPVKSEAKNKREVERVEKVFGLVNASCSR